MQEILNDQGKLIFCVMFLLVLGNAIAAIFLFVKAKTFVKNSIATKAKVLSSSNQGVGNHSCVEHTVEYKDRLGRKIKGKINYKLKTIENGKEISILYNKENPEIIKPDSKFHIYIIPIALIESAVIFGGILIYLVHEGTAKIPF
ncbi:MAG: hypothetical protein PQ612_05555 [Rickettsiales bacterium]|nr:hypothetical protein [Pseudomonadota bacterium]MDA0966485.1 hypothetical protein [Pseudomonadota bacterium]MDG4543347.1 hypothetical protein [Rickettsiales bacterium]MDG4545613.1 hypothetical protein [Rickettsiales bacterium]MDG4548062.1 hypothetical protein [Rickettsiales bacterium]